MRPSIVILTGSHLCNNPRVLKEADALSAAGYDVEVLGCAMNAAQAAEDRELQQGRNWKFTPCWNDVDFRPASRLRNFAWRVERRSAYEAAKAFGTESVSQLGGGRRAILAEARKRRADLFVAHSAATMWVASRLMGEGRAVGVDMEDWFSTEHAFPYPQNLIARLERTLLCGSIHKTCTSEAMAEALAHEYGCAPPTVVYNAFDWQLREKLEGASGDRRDPRKLSLHWYSQTLGPGRGLEDLFKALPLLRNDIEIHLRGQTAHGSEQWLDQQIPAAWRSRVTVHGIVPNVELLSRIAGHDVGFAGEMKHTRTRDLTVTNKILQYLPAGLAVVASDTAGQREVANKAPGAILVYESGDARSLAQKIDLLASSPERLAAAKIAALKAARESFSWQLMAPRLVAGVAAALARR
jgi:glycosyltransferase involved in cell wall biosynthesis